MMTAPAALLDGEDTAFGVPSGFVFYPSFGMFECIN